MDPHQRATSVWYRVAGLLRRKELAIEIVEAEIRSAQHEALSREAGADRRADRRSRGKGRARAERIIRPT
jgi:hypothetical protein